MLHHNLLAPGRLELGVRVANIRIGVDEIPRAGLQIQQFNPEHLGFQAEGHAVGIVALVGRYCVHPPVLKIFGKFENYLPFARGEIHPPQFQAFSLLYVAVVKDPGVAHSRCSQPLSYNLGLPCPEFTGHIFVIIRAEFWILSFVHKNPGVRRTIGLFAVNIGFFEWVVGDLIDDSAVCLFFKCFSHSWSPF